MKTFFDLDEETLNKILEVTSVEQLITFAKEHDVALSDEEAAKYLSYLCEDGNLSDDDLSNVSGGLGSSSSSAPWRKNCPVCGSTKIQLAGGIPFFKCSSCKSLWHSLSGSIVIRH